MHEKIQFHRYTTGEFAQLAQKLAPNIKNCHFEKFEKVIFPKNLTSFSYNLRKVSSIKIILQVGLLDLFHLST